MKKFIVFTLLLLTTFFVFAEKRYYSYVPDIFNSYFELTTQDYEKLISTKHDGVAETLAELRRNDIKEKYLRLEFPHVLSEYDLAQFIGGISGPKDTEEAFLYLEKNGCYFYMLTFKESNNIGIFYFYK